ncbi:hypothetical protein SKAU_G00160070 [Synaphobranchus kaupii]|uniref:Uncharacterized protein n=1 Tax=Synaphobranchus kaupii TaxID=118154 RepID=A0A9Q1FIC1_SYNKA|nr:hypothetical protein SKAU_G00160070 [Synaphobranchus kaupii]
MQGILRTCPWEDLRGCRGISALAGRNQSNPREISPTRRARNLPGNSRGCGDDNPDCASSEAGEALHCVTQPFAVSPGEHGGTINALYEKGRSDGEIPPVIAGAYKWKRAADITNLENEQRGCGRESQRPDFTDHGEVIEHKRAQPRSRPIG